MTSPTGPVLVVGYTMAMQKALDTFMPDDSCAFCRRTDRGPQAGGRRSTWPRRGRPPA